MGCTRPPYGLYPSVYGRGGTGGAPYSPPFQSSKIKQDKGDEYMHRVKVMTVFIFSGWREG